MKHIRISSFIFLVMLVVFMIDFIGYKVLSKHYTLDYEKNKKILFYEIKMHTTDLLGGLRIEYTLQKDIMTKKHQRVMEYMNTHDLNVDLDEIYQEINRGHENKPYNIYITDKDLVIRNSTYKQDIGFNLSFAKDVFDKHHEENIIGYSIPIRERSAKKFLTYSDSYLSKNGDTKHAVLQISYRYKDTTHKFDALLKTIQKYPMIKEVTAYSISNTGHVYEMVLNNTGVSHYKPTLQKHLNTKKRASFLEEKLENKEVIEDKFMEEEIPYTLVSMSANYKLDKDHKVIYSVLMDESDFYDRLKKLDFVLIIIAILAIVAIFILLKLRSKEVLFSTQDKFVQSAMHEIKTPLSIITLNNELRQLEYGTDSYSKEIDNALKVLNNSYRSMGFIIKKEKLDYDIKTINLCDVVNERIAFFQSIAEANEKKITHHTSCECAVKMSMEELIRLIDNNLSNAIKYSSVGSTIKVILFENLLSFHTVGKVIEDKNKIFFRYARENTTVGGYGLGLSIIKDIAQKYDIDISVQSDTKNGTTFMYGFKCHTNDT